MRYHDLAETRVTLKQPLLVLRKKNNNGQAGAAAVQLEVIGVIRHKILFKGSPKAFFSRIHAKKIMTAVVCCRN